MSQASIERGVAESLGWKKRISPVKNIRKLSKLDMKLNSALPKIEIDPKPIRSLLTGRNCLASLSIMSHLDKDISYFDKTRPECIRPFY